MDPITIIGGAIAITQAVDRIVGLSIQIKRLLTDAPDEIDALVIEISDLRAVLSSLHRHSDVSTLLVPAQDELRGLQSLVGSCGTVVAGLEKTIQEVLARGAGRTKLRVGMEWMKKRKAIALSRGRLREYQMLLALQIGGLCLTHHARASVVLLPQLGETLHDVLHGQVQIQRQIEKMQNRMDQVNGGISHPAGTRVVQPRSQGWHQAQSKDNEICQRTTSCVNFNKRERRFGKCRCRCHVRKYFEAAPVMGMVGSFFIQTIGFTLRGAVQTCNEPTCTKPSKQVVSLQYHPPCWVAERGINLIYLHGPSPTTTLSFPRIVAPDAEIAMSIREGHLDRVKDLFSSGRASPADIIYPYGYTALSLAIHYGRTYVSRFLLDVGAAQYNPNPTGRVGDVRSFASSYNVDHCTVPWSELIHDFVNLVSIDPYPDVTQRCWSLAAEADNSDDGELPRLFKAVIGMSTENPFKLLPVSRGCVNVADTLGRTVLHWTVSTNETSLVEGLLRIGADPNLQDREGKSPLHLAAISGLDAIALSLIEGGANLQCRDYVGNPPLTLAAMGGHLSTINLLVAAGADIAAVNSFDESALQDASLASQDRSVETLLALGADINHRNGWGSTALGLAVKVQACKAVEILLQHGADVRLKAYDGKSLLHLIAGAAEQHMMEHFADVTGSYLCRLDINAVDEKGRTAREYLRLRRDCSDALAESFEQLLEKVSLARKERAESDEDEVFYDAIEGL